MLPARMPFIEPEGDRCITVRYGGGLTEETVLRCLELAGRIERATLPGVLDVVPGFTTVSVHYDPRALAPSPYRVLAEALQAIIQSGAASMSFASRDIEVPVCYDAEHGFDLPFLAHACGLEREEFIALHLSAPLRVFALGFAPGLPYMGLHDERLSVPRRDIPRASVPGGSVAVANRQSVIYPDATPGGWHVIGAMPIPLFDPSRPPYAFLLPGDRVHFRRISPEEYEELKHESAR